MAQFAAGSQEVRQRLEIVPVRLEHGLVGFLRRVYQRCRNVEPAYSEPDVRVCLPHLPNGPVPGAGGVYAAYGYGGNGITFSFLAARLIGDLIAGKTSPLLHDFAIDRDGGKTG